MIKYFCFFERKSNKPFRLKNKSSLTHEFFMAILKRFCKIFLLKCHSKLMCQI